MQEIAVCNVTAGHCTDEGLNKLYDLLLMSQTMVLTVQ